MRCKLMRTGICQDFGKYHNKKFYEYGLHTKEELDKISTVHTQKRLEIMKLKESNPEKYAGLSYPKLIVPAPGQLDINEAIKSHEDEKVLGFVKKHNHNFQIYVDNPTESTPSASSDEPEEVRRRGRRPANG